MPQMALGGPTGTTSAGQAALIQEAGPPAPSDIRRRIDQDARYADERRKLHRQGAVLAQAGCPARAGRCAARNRSACGRTRPWAKGRTSATRRSSSRRKSGWFTNLFSWL